MAPIKACVLGVGLAGLTFHVPFILALPELFTLYGVLERDVTSPGGKVAARFNTKTHKIFASLDDVLKDPEVELVVVGTPNSTHYEFAKKALLAGKHVLVDKPVTPTAAEARELGEIAKSKGLVLYPFQNRRWDGDFLALKKLLALPPSDPRSLGDLHEFESHYDRFRDTLKGNWKDQPAPGIGLIYDLGTHIMDQVLALFGRPELITGFVSNMRKIGHPDVDDSFTVLFIYPSHKPHRLVVIVRAAILSVRNPQPRFIVRGTKGSFEKFGIDPQEDQIKASPHPPSDIHAPGFGSEPEELYARLDNRKGEEIVQSTWPTEPGSYIELWKNLAAVIQSGGKVEQAVKWEEAANVIEMVELAKQSAKEGRTIPVPKLG